MSIRRIVILLLSAVVVSVVSAQPDTPTFEPADCPYDAPARVSCGWLTVPENRADPASATVELAVAVVEAQNPTAGNVPIIYLEGGPGGTAVLYPEDALASPLNATHDIILLDQRGTGFSLPSLNCYEMEEDDTDAALEACYERLLDEGIDLSAYNSTENAADVDALRAALGYEQVNLWGVSYGTRLALTVMRNHPAGVRAVVLDSVFPPEINATERAAIDGLNAFSNLFDACTADPACAAAYPDLETTFYDLIADLNEDPLVFEYEDYAYDESYEIELYGDNVLDAIFNTLYDTEAIPMLPYGITLLAEASDDYDLTDAVDILSGYYTVEAWTSFDAPPDPETVADSDLVLDYIDEYGDIEDSEGMYNAVTCAEEIPFEDEDAAYDAAEAASPELADWVFFTVDDAFFTCAVWVVDPAPAVEATRVESDIPTLLISGALDPVTPPFYGDSAAVGLSDSTHIVFPGAGHGVTGLNGCASRLAAAFFTDPAANLDTSCVPSAVAWYLDD